MEIWRIFTLCFQLLTRKEKLRLIFFVAVQSILSLLDVTGILIISVLSVQFFQANSASHSSLVLEISKLIPLNSNSRAILLIISILALLIKSLSSIFFTSRLMKFMESVCIRLSVNLHKKLFDLSPIEFARSSSAEIPIQIVDGSKAISLGVIAFSSVVLSELVLLIVLITPLAAFSLSSLIIVFPFFGIGLISVYKFVGNHAETYGSLKSVEETGAKFSIDRIGKIAKFINVSKNFNFFQGEFYVSMSGVARANSKLHFYQQIPKFAMETLILLSGTLVVIYNSIFNNVESGVSAFILLFAISYRMLPGLLRIQGAIIFIRANIGDANSYFALNKRLNSLTFLTTQKKNMQINYSSLIRHVKIVVSDLDFSYTESPHEQDSTGSDKMKTIFKDFNCEIPDGKITAIVGPSGSGKSTFVDLLLGFHQPQKGEISYTLGIDDVLRVGYMPQETLIYDGTLAMNVALGLDPEDIDYDLVTEVLSEVELELNRFNPSLALGDSNMPQLSGGEKQRLGLARALYLRPNLLILDEPSAALDSQSENRILKLLTKLKSKTTILIISHSRQIEISADSLIHLTEF